MFRTIALLVCLTLSAALAMAQDRAPQAPVSAATSECLMCHESLHPGIVEAWKKSRHAAVTPAEAFSLAGSKRRISAESVPEKYADTAVGCAECHTTRAEKHADSFPHSGYSVHVAVSPDDCAQCHAKEREQYTRNIMAEAWGNLAENPLFMQMVRAINDVPVYDGGLLSSRAASTSTDEETCFFCHGTKLRMTGIETRDTIMGEMEFPLIEGWPNSGVGRVNLDGSKGSCTACHARHQFSMEMARKPETCMVCHSGPDVPAYKVYKASRHGNLHSALGKDWNYSAIPWTAGQDFGAPTCAVCHVSRVAGGDGVVVAERTHAMSDRLPWRIFGVPYATAHPKSADTSIIRNADGQPLPATLDNRPATEFLVDKAEQNKRLAAMQSVCLPCHDASWVDGYFARLETTIEETNAATLAATRIMQRIWAEGLADDGNPFDEYIERVWARSWLFYATTTRFASAMAGGGDYAVFENGRYQLMETVRKLDDWHRARSAKADVNTATKTPTTAP